MLDGYELIKSKKETIKQDSITITKDYVFFSITLKKKLEKKYIGFYFNAKEQKIAIHISPVNQSGYYKATASQFRSKDVLKMFHSLGWGVITKDMITKLNYQDENTIVIGHRYPKQPK